MFEIALNTYGPIQKLTKAESNLKSKPRLTKGVMTSVKSKNVICKKIIKAKKPAEKKDYIMISKTSNLVIKLHRIRNAKHYHHCFTNHNKNMIKT